MGRGGWGKAGKVAGGTKVPINNWGNGVITGINNQSKKRKMQPVNEKEKEQKEKENKNKRKRCEPAAKVV